MRTTIDIPDETYRELKIKAAHEGVAVRKILHRGIARELESAEARPIRKLKLPLIPSSRPGALNLTSPEIDDVLFP